MEKNKKINLDELVNLSPGEVNERLHQNINTIEPEGLREVTAEELDKLSDGFDKFLRGLKKEITGK